MSRALLIGSSHGGLDVEPSVDVVRTWLLNQDFPDMQIERLVGQRATRSEILAGLRRLGDVDHGEAPVLVYYAGHGHLYRTGIGAPVPDAHVAYPLLVATDIDRSASETLHSVFSSELSRELRRISRRARNLTVILDCCHASGMVRLDDEVEGELVVDRERALHREASARVAGKRPFMVRGAALAGPRELGERVVVVAASSAGGRAYPHPTTGRMVFTEALLAALDAHSTWDAVLAATRASVQEVWPSQQPAVFGPRFRKPFTLDEAPPEHELYRVERDGDQLVLMAGALREIHRDDRFELVPIVGTADGPASSIGPAEPRTIEPDRTVLCTPLAVDALPRSCRARRTHRGLAPVVALDCADEALRGVLADVAASTGLRVGADSRDVVARLVVRDGRLGVYDCLDDLVHLAAIDPLSGDGLARCLRRLDIWRGVARRVLGAPGGSRLYRYYDLQWGIPTSAGIAVAPGPIRVRPGEVLAVALRNLDRGAPELYAHVFRIRADREIQPWSAGTGAQFCAARQHVDAADLRAGLARAYAVDGPLALPPGPYREWTLVVVSRAAFDIDLLRTPVSARALPAGLQLTSKPSARGEGPPRDFDIVAFPYTLDLGRDSRL